MGFMGIRGGAEIDELIEFKAHLASLLRLENVGILLGSGASVPAGGMTIQGLWNCFTSKFSESADWLVRNDFIEDCHVAKNQLPNIENLVNALEIAYAEWTRQGQNGLKELLKVRIDLNKAILQAAMLDKSLWGWMKDINENDTQKQSTDALASHKLILQKLLAARQPGQAAPWVFTTNYDLAIEWAADSIDLHTLNGFIGLHRRKFSPQSFDLGFRNIQTRGEARFGSYNIYLAKLHGSLTWFEHSGEILELQAPIVEEKLTGFLSEGSPINNPGFLVMPRAAKYIETIGFVLGELFRRFSEFLSRPQTALIINGYSFGDEHINRLLLSGALNPTLQLVVYFPEFTDKNKLNELPKALRRLIELRNPRVTVIGGGAQAFINQLAAHLPDPLLYDESTQRYKELLDGNKQISGSGNENNSG